ncbi:hypothetical protein GCM10017602_18180 [Herbiconiux flava]|nr:hypothetical protein GCM10017602_18180 [Herbiconiux flava]
MGDRVKTVRVAGVPPRKLVLQGREYGEETLQLLHEEVVRCRDAQLQSVAQMQTRAGLLVGSASIAAALVGVAADSSWWTTVIALFLIAALLGLAAAAPTTGFIVQPRKAFEIAAGQDFLPARHVVVANIIKEYETYSALLARQRRWATAGIIAFVLAAALCAVIRVLSQSI